LAVSIIVVESKPRAKPDPTSRLAEVKGVIGVPGRRPSPARGGSLGDVQSRGAVLAARTTHLWQFQLSARSNISEASLSLHRFTHGDHSEPSGFSAERVPSHRVFLPQSYQSCPDGSKNGHSTPRDVG